MSLEFKHIPVMSEDIDKILAPYKSGIYIDCTFGGGGITRKILSKKNTQVISIDRDNFVEFFSMGNKLGQNYNTDQENDLRFSESTRRKTLPKSTLSVYKKLSRDTKLDDIIESPTKNKVSNDINSKLSERIMSISSNNIDDRLRYQNNLYN